MENEQSDIQSSIRIAEAADVDELVRLEKSSFDTDRISKRQFNYILSRANATTYVSELDGHIAGYAMVFFHKATSVARLYSIAVDERARGKGIARTLVETAEEAARGRDKAVLRLEVKDVNEASIALFASMGYSRFGTYEDYYEDHANAIRFEKSLAPMPPPELAPVPFYEQTLEFTCGPAALMMAMKGLDPGLVLDRKLELRIWREATTVFMTSGHGGCGPYGLALSALHRGYGVELWLNDRSTFLIDSVRSEDKKEVMRLVQEDMEEELDALGVSVKSGKLDLDQIEKRYARGSIALVLISIYQLTGSRAPHWVVVTGFDEHFIYVHDPYVDYEEGKTPIDSINIPVLRTKFKRMTGYGRTGVSATVLLSLKGRGRATKRRRKEN